LLSGDNTVKVKKTAAALGIFNAEGGLLPEQKVQRVQALQRQGKVVAMVGDGVNDAPVLAGADVSIAMGDGTELAQITADAVLMNRLDVLVEAVQCAQRTLAVMKQNLIWAGTYNALAIPAAAMGWVSPLAAAIGMSASSLWVILNAMRLLKWKASTY
jgi:Cu2+-exporting ATPase